MQVLNTKERPWSHLGTGSHVRGLVGLRRPHVQGRHWSFLQEEMRHRNEPWLRLFK